MNSDTSFNFDERFKALIGNSPFYWQRRLFHEHFAGHIPGGHAWASLKQPSRSDRLRDSFTPNGGAMAGPVEVDETYMGGKNANKHAHKKIKNANGTIGKTAVVGMKDRDTNTVQAAVVERTNQETLQGFVNAHKEDGAKVYSDEHGGYLGLDNHEVVKHSAGEYVKEQAHTNGIESFWSMLKRGYVGTYHQMSVKHLDRYVNEFAGRHNARPLDTIEQMARIAHGLVGKHLRYQDLTAS